MTTTGSDQDATLEAALATLRANSPPPSAALVARVLADAEAARAAPAPSRGWLWRVADAARVALPMPAGLAAALVLGVWLGADPPAGVLALEEALFGAALEFYPADLDAALADGVDP